LVEGGNERSSAPPPARSAVGKGEPEPYAGADGKPIAVLCKQVEQATTDVDGHLGFGAALQAGVANRVQQWTYDRYGQVLTAKGPRTDVNETTTYVYYADTTAAHTLGDLSQITNPAGHVTQFPIYNKHGQVLRVIDPNGIVTDNTYDLRQRLKTSTAGGLETIYTYDPAGQLTRLTLPDQTVVTYAYDPAHRLTKVTDQAGNSVTYTLDNAGNRIQEQIKDPSGALSRTITRAFDALRRAQQVTGAAN